MHTPRIVAIETQKLVCHQSTVGTCAYDERERYLVAASSLIPIPTAERDAEMPRAALDFSCWVAATVSRSREMR
jgi:hypothetical protein